MSTPATQEHGVRPSVAESGTPAVTRTGPTKQSTRGSRGTAPSNTTGSDDRRRRSRQRRPPEGGTRKTSRGASTGRVETQTLAQELDEQMKYRDTVAWSVQVLEQSIAELELQLDGLTKGNTDDADTEFKLRYEAQRDLNEKLEEQTQWYSTELAKTKERFNAAQQRASYNLTTLCQEYSYDADLDQYTEAELSVMVRQLERQRNISYSEFRNKTWLLDSRSQEYHQLKDLSDAYSGDLCFVNRSLEDMWRKRSSGNGTNFGTLIWSGDSSLRGSQRTMFNHRHGPVRKTAGVRSLPRLDPEAIDGRKRSNSTNRRTGRTRSLDERGRRRQQIEAETKQQQRYKSAQAAPDRRDSPDRNGSPDRKDSPDTLGSPPPSSLPATASSGQDDSEQSPLLHSYHDSYSP